MVANCEEAMEWDGGVGGGQNKDLDKKMLILFFKRRGEGRYASTDIRWTFSVVLTVGLNKKVQ